MRHFEVLASGLNQFEVGRTAYISYLNRDVEAYVDVMFTTTTYMKSYKYIIATLNGSDLWPHTEYIPPLPPINRRMADRPVTKRKRGVVERLASHKVSKAGKKIKCSICREPGNNKATFPTKGPDHVNTRKKKKQKVSECGNNGVGVNQVNKGWKEHEEVELPPIEVQVTATEMPVNPTEEGGFNAQFGPLVVVHKFK
ncbi:unnamed protein product [Lactuca virosa]|uniref:Uncharacterized protein n=1 Tax=Lactuca virosa TaxID=75947 RepID=A0AAU9PWY6_9ASTR|nr:unnamed protein product [Lactuca virosa]